MNKIIKFLPVMIILAFAGCSEDFIDLKQQGRLTDQNYFDDDNNAVMFINACYDAISWDEGIYLGVEQTNHFYEWLFGDVLSDDSKKGSQPDDYQEVRELEEWRAKTSLGFSKSMWMASYKGLFRINMALLRLPDAEISEALKSRLLGEAYFLRAYSYFYLVRVFGGVPLFTEPVKPSEYKETERASIADVYRLIEDDLVEAMERLPEKSEYDDADLGRATKGAARAYLARAIMYQIGMDNSNDHTWQEVFDLTRDIINSGEYELFPNYAAIHEIDGENCSESIFEVQFADNNEGWGTVKAGTTSSVFQGNRTMTYHPAYKDEAKEKGEPEGWGFNTPTQEFVNSYDPNDPRRICTAYGDGEVHHGILQRVDPIYSGGTGYYNRKARIDPDFVPISMKSSPTNIRKMRYADVLLMQAEAAYYQGDEGTARTRVNQVRERARTSTKQKGSSEGKNTYVNYREDELPANLLPDITSSGQALLEDIWLERRHELGMEGLRYWDLVRTGRYYEALNKKYPDDPSVAERAAQRSIPAGGKVVNPIPVLPIPVSEAVSYGLEQNPGYN
jgi:starch-binding outer membrane protein, SusD/RagB family